MKYCSSRFPGQYQLSVAGRMTWQANLEWLGNLASCSIGRLAVRLLRRNVAAHLLAPLHPRSERLTPERFHPERVRGVRRMGTSDSTSLCFERRQELTSLLPRTTCLGGTARGRYPSDKRETELS